MKNILFLVALVPSILIARTPKYDGPLGPSDAASSNITLSAPGAGKKNCLDFVVFNSTASNSGVAQYFILSNQTTNYIVTVATTNPPVVMTFPQTPWCGEINESVSLKSNARAYEINYKGFIQDLREYEGQ